MPLQVYTSTIRYSGSDKLDVSVKSGSIVFSPTWQMVLDHKTGVLSDEHYTDMYYNLMRISYKDNPDAWELLLFKGRVVLCCYCKPGDFCHRRLLADILVKLGAQYGGEIPWNSYYSY